MIKILIPVLVFAALLTFFVLRLPRSQPATTSISPSPVPNSQLPTPNSKPTELQLVTSDLRSFRLDDPDLAAPAFSHSLDIPEE